MRITIHAGYHKSGTTTVQHAWERWYRSPGDCWYPTPSTLGPGHAAATFAHRSDVLSREITHRGRALGLDDSIGCFADSARAQGVEHLVLSSEEFDRFDKSDWARLEEILEPAELSILFTITRPSHRWYAIWQELVKHGLPVRPAQAARLIADHAALGLGGFERLVRTPHAARIVVRLVRTDPPEPDLAESLAELMDLPLPGSGGDNDSPSNVSLGAAADLLRDLNARGETLGLLTPASAMRFEEAMRSSQPRKEFPAAAADFDFPTTVADAAADEQRFLRSLAETASIELIDPLGLLEDWTATAPPRWIDQLLQSAWGPYEGSDLDGWSAAHELVRRLADAEVAMAGTEAALLATEARSAETSAALTSEQLERAAVEAQAKVLADALDAVTQSRSWNLTAPLRAMVARTRPRG